MSNDVEEIVPAARAVTGPAGVDIILDAVMGPALSELATVASPNGTLVTIGWLDPRPAPMPTTAPLTIHRYMSFEHTLDDTVVPRIAAFLAAGVRSGVLSPVVGTVFTLDDIVEAHRRLEEGRHVGKIVVTV